MADINISGPGPGVKIPSGVFIDNPTTPWITDKINEANAAEDATPPSTDLSPEQAKGLLVQAARMMPVQAQPGSVAVTAGTYVPLTPSLRYNDAEGIGYSPYIKDIEDRYARKFVMQNALHNLAGFGSKVLGAAAEGLAFIPTLIAGIGEENYLEYITGGSALSKGIHEWTMEVDQNLPVYRTNYEDSHPVLKYFNVFDPASFMNTWTGQLNQLGFTVGAIGGALLEGAAITALTGGVGIGAGVAVAAAKLARNIGRISRVVASTPKALKAGEVLLSSGRVINSGLSITGDVAQFTNVSTDMVQAKRHYDYLKSITNGTAKANKIGDMMRQQYGLISSARAEGVFEANQTYEATREKLMEDFRKEHGRLPGVEELIELEGKAQTAANITMAGNMVVLYLSNKINWGSLFRPTSNAIKGTTIAGWGKNIARTSISPGRLVDNKMTYELLKRTPESTIGKVLLNSQKLGPLGFRSVNEGIQEGLQFTISTGATEYATKHLDPQNRYDVASIMTNMMYGLDQTINTNEGIENIMAGFMGGKISNVIMSAINRKAPTRQKIMQDQVDVLNASNLGDIHTLEQQLAALSNPTLFAHEGLKGKFDDLAKRLGLAKQHEEAIKNGQIKKAKDLQLDLAIAYWTSAEKSNILEARKEEIDSLRDLEGDSFLGYWGMEYNEANVKKANEFLDKQLAIADKVSKDYKIERAAAGRNPFNKKRSPHDYEAREQYVEAKARARTRADLATDRIREITGKLREKDPHINLDAAVQLTSNKGLQQLDKEITQELGVIQQQIDVLTQQSEDTANYESIKGRKEFEAKHKRLSELQGRLQALMGTNPTRMASDKFVGKQYLELMKDLWKLRSGISLSTNEYMDNPMIARRPESNPVSVSSKPYQESKDYEAEKKKRQAEHEGTRRDEGFTNESLNGLIDNIYGSIMTPSAIISDQEIADNLEAVQDLYTLGRDMLDYQRLFAYLKTKEGETEFAKSYREAKEKSFARIAKMMEEGKVPVVQTDEAEAIRQEEYEQIDHPEELETQDKENIREASKKPREEWTDEEALSVQQFPDVYEQYEEAEKRAKARITAINTERLNEALGEELAKTVNNSNYTGLKPDSFLQGMFFNSAYFSDSYNNTLDELFNSGKDAIEILNSISARIIYRPNLNPFESRNITSLSIKEMVRSAASKEESEWSKEEQKVNEDYPGLIEDYRDAVKKAEENKTHIQYRAADGSTAQSGLQRQDNFEVIQLRIGGKVIGEMRNPNNITYLDKDGNSHKVFDSNGNFILNPALYQEFTGNSINTYNAFKESVEGYAKGYVRAFKHIEKNGSIKAGEFNKFFGLRINPGSIRTNLKRDSESDIYIEDAALKKYVIFKVTPDIVNGKIISSKIEIVDSKGYTKEEQDILLAKAQEEQNNKQITNIRKPTAKGNNTFLVAAFPIVNTTIKGNSFVRVREAKREGVNTYKVATNNPNIYNNIGINFDGVSQNPPKGGPTGGKTGPVIKPAPENSSVVLATELKPGDRIHTPSGVKEVKNIEENVNVNGKEIGVIEFTDGTSIINNRITDKRKWAFYREQGVGKGPFSNLKVVFNYQGRKYNLIFENDIDKHLFILRRHSSTRTHTNFKASLDYLRTYFPGMTDNQIVNYAQLNVYDKVIDNINLDVNKENIFISNTIPTQEAQNENIKDPYTFDNTTRNMNSDTMGEKVSEEIKNYADRTSKTFGIISNRLKELGYTIEQVDKEPKVRQKGVIYFVGNEYIAIAKETTSREDEVNRSGGAASQKDKKGSGVNTGSLWGIYTLVYNDLIKKTAGPVSREEELTQSIKNAEYAYNQLQEALNERIEALEANGMPKDEAAKLAYDEMFRKGDGSLNDDGTAYELLRNKIKQEKAELQNIKDQQENEQESSQTEEAETSNEQISGIEQERNSITPDEFIELVRLAKYFLENPKEHTTTGSVVNKYPNLFKEVQRIEKERQEELDLKGETVFWDYYGNEKASNWNIGKKTKTRKGKDAVELIQKRYVGGMLSTVTEIVPLSVLQEQINAKYNSELDALNNQTASEQQTQAEQQKAEIERRRQEDFQNENESYRVIVGDEAFNDIVESGVVRTNANNKGGQTLAEKIAKRPTLYPSFSKGSASMGYANANPNNYIIVTEDASIQPSTSGRHGKGTTMFPTDENGKHLTELDGKKVKVYKHIGNGEYILVYAYGKQINTKYNAESDALNNQTTSEQQGQEEVVTEEVVITEEQKKQAEAEVTVVRNKQDIIRMLMTGLFGNMTRQQATMMATIIETWVNKELKEGRIKTKAEGYAKFKYGNKAAFEQARQAARDENNDIYFNAQNAPQLQAEIEESKKKNKYPKGKTNLSEALWHITKTPIFKKWFGKSVVKDENGDPLVQWHWSPSSNIEEFNLSGVGTHVGTEEAAKEIKEYKGITAVEDPFTGIIDVVPGLEGKFYPMFVRLENPLRILDIGPHDLGEYYTNIVYAFKKHGITLTDADLWFMNKSTTNKDGALTPHLKELLNKYGFDGFVYTNNVENKGSTSYIVVDKPSLKLVSAQAFNPESGNIYNQEQKKITMDDIRKCL